MRTITPAPVRKSVEVDAPPDQRQTRTLTREKLRASPPDCARRTDHRYG